MFGQYTAQRNVEKERKRDFRYPSESEAITNARTSYIRKEDQLRQEDEEIVWSRKWGPYGVRYRTESGKVVFRLYDTDIVTIVPGQSVTLNTGGWDTMTTRRNMMDALYEIFGEYVGIFGDKGNSGGRNIINFPGGRSIHFDDEVTIPISRFSDLIPIWDN